MDLNHTTFIQVPSPCEESAQKTEGIKKLSMIYFDTDVFLSLHPDNILARNMKGLKNRLLTSVVESKQRISGVFIFAFSTGVTV